MDAQQEIQQTIEKKAPEFLPFLRFIEATDATPVEAMGHKVSYNDRDLNTVVIAVYLYALHREDK